MLTELPSDIQEFLRPLIEQDLDIWLIGSRANQTYTAASDWDFIIKGNESVLVELSKRRAPSNIDALVVYDGDSFRCPWPRPSDGWVKSGSLSQWGWSDVSPTEAKYIRSKSDDDWYTVHWGKAVKVSP